MKIFYYILLLHAPFSYAGSYNDKIPAKAIELQVELHSKIMEIFPEHPLPPYMSALIEHESCITLSHSRCWSHKSKLKTKREEGAGFFQITRAYDKSGLVRFDNVNILRTRYKVLEELTWDNIYDRPDLQMKAGILLWKNIYIQLPEQLPTYTKIHFADAAYNGGYRGMYRDRQRCKLKPNCDPTLWFDNVELTCTKSKRIIYGNRNACDINRHHVRDVILNKLDKYVYLWLVELNLTW